MTEDKNNFRISILGESQVGKTCLLTQYVGGVFDPNYIGTIGYDKIPKKVQLSSGKEIKLALYDTAGQERYKAITKNLLTNTQGALVVYSVETRESFEKVSYWIEQIKQFGEEIPIVLVANKIDLPERQVTKEEGESFANKNNLSYFETSAKNEIGIKEPFQKVAELVYEVYGKDLNKKNDLITITPKVKKKGGCCNNKSA